MDGCVVPIFESLLKYTLFCAGLITSSIRMFFDDLYRVTNFIIMSNVVLVGKAVKFFYYSFISLSLSLIVP